MVICKLKIVRESQSKQQVQGIKSISQKTLQEEELEDKLLPQSGSKSNLAQSNSPQKKEYFPHSQNYQSRSHNDYSHLDGKVTFRKGYLRSQDLTTSESNLILFHRSDGDIREINQECLALQAQLQSPNLIQRCDII